MIGRTLSHYKVLEKLGSGGMGDVYLAEDLELERKVALKVLPAELSGSDQRRARLKREAKAVAALNHPNIVTVHSVEEAEGVHFITMELVEGKTLADSIPKEGFQFDAFLAIAIPLADAVAAAHERGIVHRDLKPGNVMLTDDGRVKVLDFGLAVPGLLAPFAEGASESPTRAKTEEGHVVGTAHYMSPEQAEGKAVDHRSDIFSLGVVLYEMATGERPFHGDSTTAVLSSILRDTPAPLTEVRPELPRDLEKAVRRCLAKDPEDRLQAAKDLRNELRELKEEVPQRPARWKALPRVAVVSAALVLVVVAAWLLGRRPRDDDIPRFANAVRVTTASGRELWPSWSPDGSRLAYMSDETGNWDIWVTEVGSGLPVNRTADFEGDDKFPSWSPDGRNIAFRSARDGGGSDRFDRASPGIFIMPSLAGPPRRVSRQGTQTDDRPYGLLKGSQSFSPQWSTDGTELAYVVWESDGWYIEIASLETEGFGRLSLPAETEGCWDLSWSPNGGYFAYLDVGNTAVNYPRLILLNTESADVQVITDSFSVLRGPSWSADERALYFVGNSGGSTELYRQWLTDNGAPDGEPRSVTVGIGMSEVADLSPDGTKLAYSKGGHVSNVWRVPILDNREATWADASQVTFEEALIEFVDVSPDRNRLLITSYRTGNGELFMLPLEGGQMQQLTVHPAMDNDGSWSPDGAEIAFYSNRAGDRDIWVMPASGGPALPLTEGPGEDYGPSWSPDGKMIAFERIVEAHRGAAIHVVQRQGRAVRRIASKPDGQWWPAWSPDGQWIAFEESVGGGGGAGVWIVPSKGGTPERLTQRGARPRWTPDGKELFYRREGAIWSLELEGGGERMVTRFEGQPGHMAGQNFATDGKYLYFIWTQDRSDIWVMDVVTDE